MSRLDEIIEVTSGDLIDGEWVYHVSGDHYDWFIQQAESNKHLLEQIDVTQELNERLRDRVEELEKEVSRQKHDAPRVL